MSPAPAAPLILSVNGGSSSIKFALFETGSPPRRIAAGRVERIGLPGSTLALADGATRTVDAPDAGAAISVVMSWLEERAEPGMLRAVGHRIVHGGPRYGNPEIVTPELLEELRRIAPYDPEHMPGEIALIEAFAARKHPPLQVACFDTGFHRDLPRVARLLPLPRRYETEGVRRYGFHGLSYAYVLETLGHRGRMIFAHLGNGASLAAVHDGRPVDTSMGFTPTSGVPMGRRSGDLDPGLGWYLARTEAMTAEGFHRMVTEESGLLGISGTSSDMRELLERQAVDEHAAEAVAFFCYQVKKWIGAYAAALGGLDTLAFTGGIGENAPEIRARVCEGLDFLGVRIDRQRNAEGAAVISEAAGRVSVRVVRTDEELMIAKAVGRILEER